MFGSRSSAVILTRFTFMGSMMISMSGRTMGIHTADGLSPSPMCELDLPPISIHQLRKVRLMVVHHIWSQKVIWRVFLMVKEMLMVKIMMPSVSMQTRAQRRIRVQEAEGAPEESHQI